MSLFNNSKDTKIILNKNVDPSYKKKQKRKRDLETSNRMENGILLDDDLSVSFKRVNVKDYSTQEQYIKDVNNLEFLFMQKMKNVLTNISKLNKKVHSLDCKVNTITKNINKKMDKIHTKLDIIISNQSGGSKVVQELNIEKLIDEKIYNEKVRSHKLEEYGFYN